jgi:protein transport protein SEC61 subunit alpha
LDIIKPFVPYLPEVAAPERKVPFQQRMMWTGVRENPFVMTEMSES